MNTMSVIISTITMMVAITSSEAAFIPTSPCTMIQPSISHHSIIEPTHPISAGGCYSSTNSFLLAYQERSRYDQKGGRSSGSVGNNNNKRRRSDDFVSGNFDNDDNRGYDKFEDDFSNEYTPQ